MKILTKEEEQEHYRATLKGGLAGGTAGLALGVLGMYAATARYPAFRHMTLPLRAFLVTSTGTFGSIITADHYSRGFEKSKHPEENYQDDAQRLRREALAQQSGYERFMTFGRENRYKIVGVSWLASMALALTIVGRSVMSPAQKLVQARVYAQSLTVAVLLATAVFEVGDRNNEKGRWEKVLDPNDPEHKHLIDKQVHQERYPGEDQWRDMVEAEEQKEREWAHEVHEQEEKDRKSGKVHKKKAHHNEKNGKNHAEKKDEK